MSTVSKFIPKVGKVYHVFDDGKVTWVRHRLEKCIALIPFEDFKKHWMYSTWCECVKECDWLYSETTDYVAVCKVVDDIEDEPLYYARTKDGEWYGFGTFIDNGILDVDRSKWEYWIDYVRSELTEYGLDEIKEMEECDKY